MRVVEAWALLGIEPTDEPREVRRAYARLLKTIDVDADAAGFVRLREALELAQAWGSRVPEWETEEAELDELPPIDAALDHDFPEYAGPQGLWRPALPNDLPGIPGEATAELDRLLFEDVDPDPERVASAGEALLRAWQSAPVDDAPLIESWLRSALAASIPKSDPLIRTTIDHFKWESARRTGDWMQDSDLDLLLQRLEDKAFVQRCKGPFHPRHRALAELSRTGRERVGLLELGLAREVKSLLHLIDSTHPTAEHDLDPDALAWWRSYFSRRHLPSSFWFLVAGIPPAATFAVAIAFASAERPGPPLWIIYPGAIFLTLAGIFAFADLRARIAARDRQWNWDGESSRKAMPFLIASLLLPPLAAVVQTNAWTAFGWTLASLAAALGGVLTSMVPRDEMEMEAGRRRTFVAVAALVSLAALISAPPLAAAHLAAPLVALCFVAWRGFYAASIGMSVLRDAGKRGVLLAAGLFASAVLLLLFAFAPSRPPPLVLSLVPVAIIIQHYATSTSYAMTPRLEWGLRVIAILYYFTGAAAVYGRHSGAAMLAALSVYGLTYSVARLFIAFRERGEAMPAHG